MLGLAPLAVFVLVLLGVFALGRTSHHHPVSPGGTVTFGRHQATEVMPRPVRSSGEPRSRRPRTVTLPVRSDSLAAWAAVGLITAEQAERIAAYERNAAEFGAAVAESAPATGRRRVPFVAEALGYLGGILGIVGLVLLVAKYWPDMATPGRLALSGGGAALLAAAGALVHEAGEAAFTRLRWFLWLLSSVAGGLFAGVLAIEWFGSHPANTVALMVAATVTVQNAAFWWWHERPLQQLLTLAGLAATVGLGVDRITSEGPTGAAVLAVGALLVAAGWHAFTPQPAISAAVGGAAAVVGAGILTEQWRPVGLVILLVTSFTLLALAALPEGRCTPVVRTALTVTGGMGALQAVAPTISYFGQHAGIATGAAVWSIGACLVLLGSNRALRSPLVVETLGGVAIVGGAAVMGMQSTALATTFGMATAAGLIAWGTVPGRVLLSLCGSVGLLVNVPWAITHFFPGEGRAPLLILTSGAVIVAVAVWLARMGGRFRSELRR